MCQQFRTEQWGTLLIWLSFLRAAEFRDKPRNLPVAADFDKTTGD